MTNYELRITHATVPSRLSPARRWSALILAITMLPLFACNRYAAHHELECNGYFAEIVQRVDRRWIGNDRFFEDNLLANPYPEVRQWCAIALGRIASPRGLPWLYQAMQTGDASVRAAAAFAVGEILDRESPEERSLSPGPEAISLLRSLLDDPSFSVQMRAVEALGKIGTPGEAGEILRRLERASHEGNGSAIEQAYLGFAITALARLGDPAAEPMLERLAKAVDSEIRSRASEALVHLQDKTASATAARQAATPKPHSRALLVSLQKFGVISGAADSEPVESSISELVSRTLAASRKTSTIAMVETTRGNLEIELFREDAPVTVAHFVVAAEQGNYNFIKLDDWLHRKSGFVFEQVIPSRQIGGDVLEPQPGFGWALNGEINMRPFERGSVGMAVDVDNPDHRRLFITLTPQPFLDGVDTCIGRVISGMPVADRIVSGDKILRISIKETISFLNRIRY
jgi:peptidyl-prolyl cis-trans isomerase B (cyclophilin B)